MDLQRLAAEVTEEHATELPMPAEAFGLIALAALFALLAITWAFRDIGNKH